MKRLTLIAAGLIMALTTVPVAAHPHGGAMMIKRCLRMANVQLTQAQRDKLRLLRDQMRLQRDKLRPQMRKLRIRDIKAFANPNLTDKQVIKIIQKDRAKRMELMSNVMEKFIRIRDILTPQQLKKIANTPKCLEPPKFRNRKQMMMRGRGGMGRGGMGRGGMGRGW